MIKKRTRPQPRVREQSPEEEQEVPEKEESGEELPLSDLIELRKLKKTKQGIDANKLVKGDVKKRKKRPKEEEKIKGGLQTYAVHADDDEDENKEAKARRAVREYNFTQQTNTLDVDKHMMAYIEEQMQQRMEAKNEPDEEGAPLDPQDELFTVEDKWKVAKKDGGEGSVTNSMQMLTAIPEVDLGMDTRLRNIEETEKAKRAVAEERKDRRKIHNDEEHLVATRFYRPNLRQKSDADILREAKLEAMGLPVYDEAPQSSQDRIQMATDELVMERFKKRMRK